jgi:hypothetical protein
MRFVPSPVGSGGRIKGHVHFDSWTGKIRLERNGETGLENTEKINNLKLGREREPVEEIKMLHEENRTSTISILEEMIFSGFSGC